MPQAGSGGKMPLVLWWLLISNMLLWKPNCLRIDQVLLLAKFYSDSRRAGHNLVHFKVQFDLTKTKSGSSPSLVIPSRNFYVILRLSRNQFKILSLMSIKALESQPSKQFTSTCSGSLLTELDEPYLGKMEKKKNNKKKHTHTKAFAKLVNLL